MSPIQYPPLPFDTARAAESVFGREHPYLRMGASLETLWGELDLTALGFTDPFLSNSFYPYSFVTILQYWEYLTDRQMSQATRTRLDMKYALHLPLNFPGIQASLLCEFRQHVLSDQRAQETLDGMVHSLGNFAGRETSTVHVNEMLPEICLPSRAERILECVGLAIEAVASQDPDLLKTFALPHWYRRYYQKFDRERIPRNRQDIELLIQSVGNDGWHLMEKIKNSNATVLSYLPEIKILRDEWRRQFLAEGDSLKFRESHCLTCSRELQIIKNTSTRKEEGVANHMSTVARTFKDRTNH